MGRSAECGAATGAGSGTGTGVGTSVSVSECNGPRVAEGVQ